MELQNHPFAQYSKLPDAWNKEILVVQSTPWITSWSVTYSMSDDYHLWSGARVIIPILHMCKPRIREVR